eukprot:2693843-Rhodomonas_salina.1
MMGFPSSSTGAGSPSAAASAAWLVEVSLRQSGRIATMCATTVLHPCYATIGTATPILSTNLGLVAGEVRGRGQLESRRGPWCTRGA